LKWNLDFIELNWIPVQLDFDSNSIEEKQDENWCTSYWKYVHHFHHVWLWCWKNKLDKKDTSPLIPLKAYFRSKSILVRAKPIGLYSCFLYTKFDIIVIIGIFENKILWQLCNWMWIKSHHVNARTLLGYWSIVLGLFWVIWNIIFQEVYVKAPYGGQKMLSQILFFEIVQLSIFTKPILKEFFINYIQNKVVQ
jgi:hypothetical protein